MSGGKTADTYQQEPTEQEIRDSQQVSSSQKIPGCEDVLMKEQQVGPETRIKFIRLMINFDIVKQLLRTKPVFLTVLF